MRSTASATYLAGHQYAAAWMRSWASCWLGSASAWQRKPDERALLSHLIHGGFQQRPSNPNRYLLRFRDGEASYVAQHEERFDSNAERQSGRQALETGLVDPALKGRKRHLDRLHAAGSAGGSRIRVVGTALGCETDHLAQQRLV